jgi:membrane protein DedA with SNARE-associated domain
MSAWLIHLLENHGLLIVFLTMVAESCCVPIPSEVVVPYGGVLAAQGHTHLWMVIVVATAANLVGSSIAYGVGRSGGRALFVRYGRYVGVRAQHLDKADRWFERRGQVTVFFTRMMPGVRTFISLPAGIAKMPVGKFLLYSFLGSVPWNTALAFLGYGAGKAAGEDPWGKLQGQFSRYDKIFYIVLAVVVVALIAWAVIHWRRNRERVSSLTAKPPGQDSSTAALSAQNPPAAGSPAEELEDR